LEHYDNIMLACCIGYVECVICAICRPCGELCICSGKNCVCRVDGPSLSRSVQMTTSLWGTSCLWEVLRQEGSVGWLLRDCWSVSCFSTAIQSDQLAIGVCTVVGGAILLTSGN